MLFVGVVWLWLSLCVYVYSCVVDYCGDVFEYFEGQLGWDVEEFSVLSDAEVCESVYVFVDEAFYFAVAGCFHGGEDFEGEGYGGVVEFFRSYVYGAGAFAYFHPIFFEAWVGEYVDESFFFIFHGGCFWVFLWGCFRGYWFVGEV